MTTKPEDIPQDVWEAVGQIFHTVANNHHAWGALEQLTPEWGADLQERIARAILAAKAEEREACAALCGGLRHDDRNSESEDWVAGTFACQSAIRKRGEG